ncbi:imm11 family protein [Pseudomonadota bacterium AL_CKDN230030165-1A_HGKHYDSX7]
MSNPSDAPDAAQRPSRMGEYYILNSSHWADGIGPGLRIFNEDKLIPPGHYLVELPTGEPDQYPEKPHLLHVPIEGGMLRDFEIWAGIWIISERLKRVLESVDAAGFAFAECDFSLADGSRGPQYYFCSVVRSLDAIDEGASRMKIKYERDFITGEDVKLYSVLGGASLVFRPEAVGNAHIFTQPQLGVESICDRVMYEALVAANLDGVDLRDAADF